MTLNLSTAQKSDRLAVRLSAENKLMLERAAAAAGRSLSDFVVSSSLSAAQQTLAEVERMRLSEADRDAFLAALDNPPAPNAALRAAAALHRDSVE